MDWRHNEYPQELAGKIFLIANDLIDLKSSAITLNSLLPIREQVYFPSNQKILNESLDAWLKGLLRGYTVSGQGNTDAEITIDDLSPKYTSFSSVMLPDGTSLENLFIHKSISLARAANEISLHYDFNGLIKELDELTAGLENKGLKVSANKIAETLKMVFYRAEYNKFRPTMTGQKASMFLTFSKDDYTYSTYLRTNLYNLCSHIRVAEQTSGLEGVHSGFQEIYDTFSRSNWKNRETRSVINENGIVSCTIFKEKLQFKMSHEAAEAIITFVKLYSDHDLWFEKEAA
jgi:hypothetical protein